MRAARQSGVSPAEFIKQVALEHLPVAFSQAAKDLDGKLRHWQQQDATPLMPTVSTATLFAQWAEEDAVMTDVERVAEEEFWEDKEKRLAENTELRLRLPG